MHQRLESKAQGLNKGFQIINWWEAEVEDASVVTDDRTAYDDKVFTLSGVIGYRSRLHSLRGMNDWCRC